MQGVETPHGRQRVLTRSPKLLRDARDGTDGARMRRALGARAITVGAYLGRFCRAFLI